LHELPPAAELKDAKTRLQEALQARSLALPAYNLISVNGEAHAQVFDVQCEVHALNLTTRGQGSSRRRAEQSAADQMLALLPAAWRNRA
ncbi:MAG: putative dsRNA-binding protein, partial [Steroidobacteraceae bacterium]